MTASATQSANVVEGEFAFTEADFKKISAMVHGDAGISCPTPRRRWSP
jgi:hypothetical protein